MHKNHNVLEFDPWIECDSPWSHILEFEWNNLFPPAKKNPNCLMASKYDALHKQRGIHASGEAGKRNWSKRSHCGCDSVPKKNHKQWHSADTQLFEFELGNNFLLDL